MACRVFRACAVRAIGKLSTAVISDRYTGLDFCTITARALFLYMRCAVCQQKRCEADACAYWVQKIRAYSSVISGSLKRQLCYVERIMSKAKSKYIESLSSEDAASYRHKLTLNTGERLRDPYEIPECEWASDGKRWPTLQWPDIYSYLIDKPSEYTKEKLKAYKSLDAYNYVVSGHVQVVKYCDLSQEFCTLKAEVLPSQRQGHKTVLYKAWIIVNKLKNFILTANCTYMAG